MSIFDHLEAMQDDIFAGDWDAFEEKWSQVAEELAGSKAIDEIAAIDVDAWEDELTEALSAAYQGAVTSEAEVVHFEYDMDNDWSGTFFICSDYAPLEEADDDWACDAIEEIEFKPFPAFARRYDPDFGESERAQGVDLYLIARTVAAYCRASESLSEDDNIAVTIGFHDQDPIVRVRERKITAVDEDGTSEIDEELTSGQLEE